MKGQMKDRSYWIKSLNHVHWLKLIRLKLWFVKRSFKIYVASLTNRIVLVTGMPRSGSTLIYNICQILSKEHSGKQTQSSWINDFHYCFMVGGNVILKIHDFDPYLKCFTVIHSSRELGAVAASQHAKEKRMPTIDELRQFRKWDKAWKKNATLSIDYSELEALDIIISKIASLLRIKELDVTNVKRELSKINNVKNQGSYNLETLRHPNHITGKGDQWKEKLPKELIRQLEALNRE